MYCAGGCPPTDKVYSVSQNSAQNVFVLLTCVLEIFSIFQTEISINMQKSY